MSHVGIHVIVRCSFSCVVCAMWGNYHSVLYGYRRASGSDMGGAVPAVMVISGGTEYSSCNSLNGFVAESGFGWCGRPIWFFTCVCIMNARITLLEMFFINRAGCPLFARFGLIGDRVWCLSHLM